MTCQLERYKYLQLLQMNENIDSLVQLVIIELLLVCFYHPELL